MNNKIKIIVAGLFVLELVLSGVGMWYLNAGWEQTVASHKKLERTLMDRIELRDQQDMAALRSSAQVKTILIEDAHEGANRAAWTIPGRVEPRTDDGRAGAYYTYLDSVGHIDGWRGAVRDEAPAVLDVTMGPVSAASPDQTLPASAQAARQLIDILKAARGARP